jgi:hypothetical protein
MDIGSNGKAHYYVILQIGNIPGGKGCKWGAPNGQCGQGNILKKFSAR